MAHKGEKDQGLVSIKRKLALSQEFDERAADLLLHCCKVEAVLWGRRLPILNLDVGLRSEAGEIWRDGTLR